MLTASILLILCIAFRFWLPNILDCVRYQADLSYTIEWGPTYWVEKWMRDLGAPGIKLLCNTRADAPRHAVSGAVEELWYVRDPVYFDLFAEAYANPSSPIKKTLLNAICCMYGKAQAAPTPDGNVKKIGAFLEEVFNSKATPDDERQMAMAALWAGHVDKLKVITEDENPAIAEFALLKLAEAQPEKYISHADSAVAGRAAFLLAETQPERHLATFANFLGDTTRKDEIREALAKEWCRLYYHTHRRPAETPLKLEELLRPAVTACRADGTPHNPVRVSIWKGLYWQTGKGVPITLSNAHETSDWLDTMSDTVRSYWDFKYSGKGIPPPPESETIETVRKCVTVPETDEEGEDLLVRRAREFLNRKEVPRHPHENLTVQRAMRDLGLTDRTVAEILSSDREEDIRKIIPYLVQSKYFGPPTGRQQYPNRLRDLKMVRNLVKLGPGAVPLLLQCYQWNAFDQMVLLNALEVCDPDFKSLFAWAESARADEIFNFGSYDVLENMALSLLAHDITRGTPLVLKGLADESSHDTIRNCDSLKERLKNVLYFIPKPNDNRTSEVDRDRLLADFRNWLSAESKPDGMLHRVCWIHPILVNKDGPLFVVYRDLLYSIQTTKYSSTSGGSLPYWLPVMADREHQFVCLTAKYREKDQYPWQLFTAPVMTNFPPGIQTLELRLTESK